MDALDFEFHQEQHKDLLASPNEETKVAANVRVLEDYELAVRSELSRFTEEVVIGATKLKSEKAQQYMRYGVGRRLRMIQASYLGIFDIIAADRREPLPLHEMAAVSRDLNVIYINIRGTLDNYAWVIFHEFGLGKKTKLKETEVGLFLKNFQTCSGLQNALSVLAAHTAWNTELKSRRDPSAHRMPLYVPPAVLDAAQAARHQELWQERAAAIQNDDFDLAEKLAEEQSKLGTFSPHFFHDPDKGGDPIYRTVPTDIGKLITIGRAIHDEIVPQ